LENRSPAKSRWTRIGKLTEAVEHVVPYRRFFWESGRYRAAWRQAPPA
jgi:hypothetical protein